MERLYWKIESYVKCPYCDDTDLHTFYLNSDTLICDHCGETFNINIYVGDIKVEGYK